ncbi:MAG: hypothetical protein LC804_26605 [Acidobacteria bacterium]|nr:hypothetical protein [Acidobacteriota bacterium]
MGELLTRGSIWIAVVMYAASEGALRRAGQSPRAEPMARWFWTCGCVAYLVHVLAAFHAFFDWSHARAYADTARQTQQMIGVPYGAGIYFNYVFTALWLSETVWWWSAPAQFRRRPRAVGIIIRGFFLFIVFNGAIVFATGGSRWLGISIAAVWALGWALSRATRRFER